jgi:DNA invertase Pin-like site-specific DNA recombinase
MTKTKARSGRTRVFIYCRISEDRSGVGAGVARQEQDCRALVERLDGQVVEVFTDNDVSAYSGKRRPGYEDMMTRLEVGEADMVVAWHPDRLHRSPKELEHYIDLSVAQGFSTQTCQAGEWDLSSASGRAIARMLGAWARYESEHKAARIERAAAQRARDGRFHGGRRPYGYDKDGITVRLDEAAVIVEAAQALVAGVSLRGLCVDLNRRGVPTATGKGSWRNSTMKGLLTNPRYAGHRALHGEVIGEAGWPAILDEPTFQAVCAILNDPARKTVAKGRTPVFLGSSLYHCGVCGLPKMRASKTSAGYRIYRCTANSIVGGSRHVGADATKVDEVVETVIVERLMRPDVVAALQTRSTTADTDALEQQLAELDAESDQYTADFLAKRITRRQLLDLTADVERRTDETRARLAALGARSPLDGLDIGRLPEIWPGLPKARKRALVDVVATVTIVPPPRRGARFTPERVRFDWKDA